MNYISDIKKMRHLSYLIFLAFLTSCGINAKLTRFENHSSEKLNLNIRVDSVIIKDLREGVTSNKMKIPTVSIPNQKILHRPYLDSIHQNLIRNEIFKQCTAQNENIDITVTILKGYKEFSASWINEKENVYIELKLELTDKNGNLKWGTSNAEYFVTSIDAKHKRMERLYRIALKNTIHNALKNIKTSTTQNKQY